MKKKIGMKCILFLEYLPPSLPLWFKHIDPEFLDLIFSVFVVLLLLRSRASWLNWKNWKYLIFIYSLTQWQGSGTNEVFWTLYIHMYIVQGQMKFSEFCIYICTGIKTQNRTYLPLFSIILVKIVTLQGVPS